MTSLVLSLFPGIGLLDAAFEEAGFCVVRGPDALWGGDVRAFNPPAGRFDGVIGGPPCQSFTPIANVNRARWGEKSVGEDLIPEFRRVVLEASPAWWLMENSPYAYAPVADCFEIEVDNAWLGERQKRRRKFWSNLRLLVQPPALLPIDSGTERAVCAKGSVDWKGSRAKEAPRDLGEMLRLQGFPADFLANHPFTVSGAKQAVANGVPLPLGRAIAKAVLAALQAKEATG